jgi:F-type H+-transporting ATPase subunit delta
VREHTIARIYADTLYRRATTENAVEAVDEGLTALAGALRDDARLAGFLGAPHIAAEEKRAVIERALAATLHPALIRFLVLVVEKRREPLLSEIAVAWRELLDERANRMSATVVTAAPLDEATRDGMRAALEKATGKTILMETKIDPAMIGGVVVRYGDSVIDGSVRSRLAAIRNRLRRAHVRGTIS